MSSKQLNDGRAVIRLSDNCHCEEISGFAGHCEERQRRSNPVLKPKRLLRSLRSLAMTKKEFSDSLIQLSLIISFSLLPSSVFAAAPPAINLPNPLGTTNLLDVGARLIQAGLGIAGSLALLFFIYGGFLWLTSAGNADKIKKGRDVFLWSIVGLVIIFSSYLLVDFVIKGLTKQGVQNQASEKQMADCGQIAQTIKDECYVGCAAPENTDPDCNNGCDEEYPINLTNCLNTK